MKKIITAFIVSLIAVTLSAETLFDGGKAAAWESKKFDIAWNVGAGLQLLNKVQVAASYGFGLTNSASSSVTGFEGKNRSWTVTLAYLF